MLLVSLFLLQFHNVCNYNLPGLMYLTCLFQANRIGYPVMLKASEGGGGKGIRMSNSDEELRSNFVQVLFPTSLSIRKACISLSCEQMQAICCNPGPSNCQL
jgi:hypothetical protein